ncbi:cuticle collagen 40-like isoform X1 [Myotis daubentonii]|uniref:cuticle collagen 40-like isoform X1 n=1 Tax=Myotis daubentonii TaxID=98922 RepID=UPI002873B40E|nr:cuticle collagen 40-like isoform X1 [Myotis daubentonii]
MAATAAAAAAASRRRSRAGRGREGPRRGPTGGAAPGEGAEAREPRPVPPAPPGTGGGWGRGGGAGRVTSRPAAPPPVPRLVRSREAHGRDRIRDQPWSPHPTLPMPAAPVGNIHARKHVNAPKHVTADGQERDLALHLCFTRWGAAPPASALWDEPQCHSGLELKGKRSLPGIRRHLRPPSKGSAPSGFLRSTRFCS